MSNIYKNMLREGLQHHKMNKLLEASNTYKAIIQMDPTNHHAMHYLGVLFFQTGYPDAGRDLINKAISMAGGYAEAEHNLNVFGKSEKQKIIQEIHHLDKDKNFPKFARNTINNWRMKRMIDFAHLFSYDSLDKWITIGDAYGHDALLLKDEGVKNCLATNLDSSFLKLGSDLKYVELYAEVNAEQIQYEDSSFAFAMCKEALHHMPRPYLAIYEMLRIVKKAVFLIEPQDQLIDYNKPNGSNVNRSLLIDRKNVTYVNNKIRYSWGGAEEQEEYTYEVYSDWYEDGAFNYVYTLSEREIKKITYGIGLPGYAFKKLNDIYDEKVGDLNAHSSEEEFKKLKEQIDLQDTFCQASGKPYAYIICILFKEMPMPEILQSLTDQGYTICYTPTVFMPLKFESFES